MYIDGQILCVIKVSHFSLVAFAESKAVIITIPSGTRQMLEARAGRTMIADSVLRPSTFFVALIFPTLPTLASRVDWVPKS